MEYDIPYPTYIPYIGPYNAHLGVQCQVRVVTCFNMCSYANFRAFLVGAILVHARHRVTTGVLNGSPQCGLHCGLGYCCIWGIWLLFRVEGGLYFLYFWILDPGF